MAEQSIRHTLMVVALMQCASETRNTAGNASEAAARCIEMFRKLFPGATPDELRSALRDAETRRNELNVLPHVDSAPDRRITPQTIRSVVDNLPRGVTAETAISDRVPYNPLNSELTAAGRSRLAAFIRLHQPVWRTAAGILGLLPVWMTRG